MPENYNPSHRTILLVVGALFLLLGLVCAAAVIYFEQYGAFLPVVVFVGVGVVCLVVGVLGSDAAVARIWKSR